MRRHRLAIAVLGALLLPLAAFSSATYTAGSPNPLNLFSTAPDFGPLTSTMQDPGPFLRGTVTLTASTTGTTDAVTIQRSPSGAASWTDVCTVTASPFECALDTTALADGTYDLRAVATGLGRTTISAAVSSRLVDNTGPTAVALNDPGAGTLTGTLSLSGTASDAGSGVANWTVQYSPAAMGAWTDVCSSTAAPYGCSVDTASIPDGVYDLRALATDRAGNTTASTLVTSRRIDNTAPSVAMVDPGRYLRGTVTLSATASDGGGVASVTLQRAPAGTASWTDLCTDTGSPYSCALDTTTLADGLYDLRASATDRAGRTAVSAVVAGVRVDNSAPGAVTLSDPGLATITGTKSFTGTASDTGSGVATWKLQYSPAGAGTWTDGCTATTAPYGCSLDTALLPDGSYDLRALATDRAGNSAPSAPWTGERIDNASPLVTMISPGAYLRGVITVSATASDGSGITNLRIQGVPAGSSNWGDACVGSASPLSCTYDTRTVADGLYYVRAVATDGAGRTSISSVVGPVRVDNTPPNSVTLNDPGILLAGSVAFSGTAGDSGSGVAAWTLQYARSGTGTWTQSCSDANAPYGCTLDTTALTDGLYDFRVVAGDAAGNTTTSAVRSLRRVDNVAPTVALTSPPTALRGSVTLGATASDGGGIAFVVIERSPSGAGTWSVICTDPTASYSCSLDTTTLADGLYDFRAVAFDNAGRRTASAVSGGHWVDNAAPTGVAMADPGSLLTGSVSFSGTAADAGSGVDSVVFQYRGNGTGTWTDACTATTAPYGCSFDTSAIGDGLHDFRALATDVAGNATASSIRTGTRVDNNAPAVTMTDPGALGPGEVLAASASDGAGTGVASVTLQIRPAGAGAWSDVCVDTTSPYSCPLDTSGLADGAAYDLRAVATDGAGLTAQSMIANRVFDGTGPRGVDVQTANGGSKPGVIESGDSLTFTFDEAVRASSILGGWDGSPTAIQARLLDNGAADQLTLFSGLTQLPFGTAGSSSLALNGDYVSANAVFAGTMTLQGGSVVQIAIGSLLSGTVVSTPAGSGTLLWRPFASITDLAGNAAQSVDVTEAGGGDAEF